MNSKSSEIMSNIKKYNIKQPNLPKNSWRLPVFFSCLFFATVSVFFLVPIQPIPMATICRLRLREIKFPTQTVLA